MVSQLTMFFIGNLWQLPTLQLIRIHLQLKANQLTKQAIYYQTLTVTTIQNSESKTKPFHHCIGAPDLINNEPLKHLSTGWSHVAMQRSATARGARASNRVALRVSYPDWRHTREGEVGSWTISILMGVLLLLYFLDHLKFITGPRTRRFFRKKADYRNRCIFHQFLCVMLLFWGLPG